MKIYNLKHQKKRQGDVVHRFGKWQSGGPTVILPDNEWRALGEPENISVVVRKDRRETTT